MVLSDNSKYPSHIDSLVEDKNISPGYGYSKLGRAFAAQANITFTPDDNFAFQLGYGKNFIGDGYRSLFLSDNANSYPYLKITAKKHDLIALRIFDQREKELPNMGLTLFEDGESGKRRWINTSKKRVRETYYNNSLSREHNILEIFKKSKVDHANICIQSGYIQPLMNLFKKR